jgi:hypothetical protein
LALQDEPGLQETRDILDLKEPVESLGEKWAA